MASGEGYLSSVSGKGQRILLKLCFVPSTGTWVTFGGQISDEVGHRSPFALTLVSADAEVKQS